MAEYELIDLAEYSRTGEGATAVAYTHKTEPRLAKLYNKGFEADEALRDLWIDLGLFSYGAPEWDIAQLWVFTNRLDEERQKLLFHLDRAQMLEHWDIFVRAYYGIDTQEEVDAAVRHLLPYAAVRIPFMLYMAYRTPISEGLARFVISCL